MFDNSPIANYAYIYTAQPLQEGAPAFCLGSDNKFTAEHVLQIWQYIFDELKKLDIAVLNFASHGDSRLLRAMRVLMSMSSDSLANHNRLNNQGHSVPTVIRKWLYVQRVPTVMCIQDTVHIGVKLKSRLLKPSIQWASM